MKQLILISISGLVLLCSAGAGVLLVLRLTHVGPDIQAIPVYAGATNIQVKDSTYLATIQTMQGVTGIHSSTGTAGQGASNQGTISFANAYVGHLTFATNDSPQQVYSYYEGVLTRAGWMSQIAAGIQVAPPTPAGGTGLSGPRLYTYDPTPLWLNTITNGAVGGYVATVTVHVRASSSGAGSEVFIILDKDEQ
jgi:hypothetical protein